MSILFSAIKDSSVSDFTFSIAAYLLNLTTMLLSESPNSPFALRSISPFTFPIANL